MNISVKPTNTDTPLANEPQFFNQAMYCTSLFLKITHIAISGSIPIMTPIMRSLSKALHIVPRLISAILNRYYLIVDLITLFLTFAKSKKTNDSR